VPAFTLKDELPRKDNGFGKITVNNAAQLLQLVDNIRTHRDVACGGKPESAGQIDVSAQRFLDVIAKTLQLFDSLEVARIDDAHRDKNHVLEMIGHEANRIEQ